MIEIIQDAGLKCGEGPVWDAPKGRLYWTDALDKAVYMRDARTGGITKLVDTVNAVSLVSHRDGGLVLGGSEGFFHWHETKGLRLIADQCDGKPAKKINDSIADPGGRVFGGQENYREDAPYEPGYLFRLDPDGTIRIVEESLHLSNGMGFSPDGGYFYLTDTIQRTIYRYDYKVHTGEIRNRRTLIKLGRDDGLPDGLTVDAAGFIWVARWFGAGLSRFDPDGRLERIVPLPVAQPSSVMFGGPNLDELYVTSAGLHWESPLAPAGHDYRTPRGGPVFRLHPGVKGLAEFQAAI